jgi:hypothetical protein
MIISLAAQLKTVRREHKEIQVGRTTTNVVDFLPLSILKGYVCHPFILIQMSIEPREDILELSVIPVGSTVDLGE